MSKTYPDLCFITTDVIPILIVNIIVMVNDQLIEFNMIVIVSHLCHYRLLDFDSNVSVERISLSNWCYMPSYPFQLLKG